MMETLADLNVVEGYRKEHAHALETGVDKKYPNLSLVRLEAMYFQECQGQLLDYGCGFGANAIHLLQRGYDVTAADTSPYAIEKIKMKLKECDTEYENKIRFKQLNPEADKLPFDDSTYDFIVCSSVLSLLATPERIVCLLKEFKRVMKPGAKAYLDINSVQGSFVRDATPLGNDIYVYQGSKFGGRQMYCPSDSRQFEDLVASVFTVDQVGFHAHSFFSSEEQEFIICARND